MQDDIFFLYHAAPSEEMKFFMLAVWPFSENILKSPVLTIDVIIQRLKHNHDVSLRIAVAVSVSCRHDAAFTDVSA